MPEVDHLTLTPKHAEPPDPRRPGRNWVLLATATTAILVIAGSAVTFLVRGWADGQAAASARDAAGTPAATTPAAQVASPTAPASPLGMFAAANPASVMTELTNRWTMTFTSTSAGTGTEQDGLAGDVTGRGRKLEAVVLTDQHGQLFDLTCRAGGNNVTAASDDTVRRFTYDCLSQAIRGPQWTSVSGWLDQHYAGVAAGPNGNANYQTSALALHLSGDGHTLTAELRDPAVPVG